MLQFVGRQTSPAGVLCPADLASQRPERRAATLGFAKQTGRVFIQRAPNAWLLGRAHDVASLSLCLGATSLVGRRCGSGRARLEAQSVYKIPVTKAGTTQAFDGIASTRGWAERSGIWISKKIQLPVYTPRGRGVLATEDLAIGEVLIKVPRSVAFIAAADRPPPQPWLSDFWMKWPQAEVRLAATILAEVAEGGPLADYYCVLPSAEKVTRAVEEEAEKRGLGEELKRSIRRRVALCEEVHSDLHTAGIRCSMADVDIALNAGYTRPCGGRTRMFWVSQAIVFGVCLVVLTAGFGSDLGVPLEASPLPLLGLLGAAMREPECEMCLLPCVDLVNHAPDVPMDLQLDGWTGEWTLRAGRRFAAGEEVVFSYDKASKELLLRFGFVEDS